MATAPAPIDARMIDLEPPTWLVATRWLVIVALTVLVTTAVAMVGTVLLGPALS